MRRSLLLSLLLGVVALALPAMRHQRLPHWPSFPAPGQREESGVVALSQGSAHFTLYWPKGDSRSVRKLVIFAADARSKHPRPLRLFAQAAAATGVAALYVEPTPAPAEAAARLKAVLRRQADKLGLDSAAVYTWVEGTGFGSPEEGPCQPHGLLRASLAWLTHDLASTSGLVLRAFNRAANAGCSAL